MNLRAISINAILDANWASIFDCTKPKVGRRLKEYDVKDEFYGDFMQLYYKVYQEAPPKKEISQFIANGHYTLALSTIDKTHFEVDLTKFLEFIINIVGSHKDLHRKKVKFCKLLRAGLQSLGKTF